jgi:hypothetical protein
MEKKQLSLTQIKVLRNLWIVLNKFNNNIKKKLDNFNKYWIFLFFSLHVVFVCV